MLNRVPGVATAWRYSNTEIYGRAEKPKNVSWQEFTAMLLKTYPPKELGMIKQTIINCINEHYSKTDNPIKDEETHILTGASWKFFSFLAVRGDFKGRYSRSMLSEAEKAQKKQKVTLEHAIRSTANSTYLPKALKSYEDKLGANQ